MRNYKELFPLFDLNDYSTKVSYTFKRYVVTIDISKIPKYLRKSEYIRNRVKNENVFWLIKNYNLSYE